MFWNHIIVSSKIIVEFPDSIFFVKSCHLSATGEILLGSFLKFDLGHTSLEYWEESSILFLPIDEEKKEKIQRQTQEKSYRIYDLSDTDSDMILNWLLIHHFDIGK